MKRISKDKGSKVLPIEEPCTIGKIEGADIEYPRNQKTRNYNKGAKTMRHFIPAWTNNGYMHMNVYAFKAKIDGVPLTVNDEIAVFDGKVCVGATKLISANYQYISIILSHNDPVTPEHDGYISGNKMTFKVWLAQLQKEITIPIKDVHFYSGYHYQDKPYFETMGTSIVDIIHNTVSLPNTTAYALDPTEFKTKAGHPYEGEYETEWKIEEGYPGIEHVSKGVDCVVLIKEPPPEAMTVRIKVDVLVDGAVMASTTKEVAILPEGVLSGEPLPPNEQLHTIGQIQGPDYIRC